MFYTELEGKSAVRKSLYAGNEGFVLAAALDEDGRCIKAFGMETNGEMGKCIPGCIGSVLGFHPEKLTVVIWNEEKGSKMNPHDETVRLCRLMDIPVTVKVFENAAANVKAA